MKNSINRLSGILFIADLFWICFGLYVATQIRIYLPFGGQFKLKHAILPSQVYFLTVSIWSLSLILMEAYNPQKVLRAVDEIRRVLSGSFIASLLCAGALYLSFREVSRYQFIYYCLVTPSLILLYRGLLRVFYRIFGRIRVGVPQRIVVVGAGELGLRVSELILNQRRWGLELVGLLDDDPEKKDWQPDNLQGVSVLGTLDQLIEIVNDFNISDIYLALPTKAYKKLQNLVELLETVAVRIKIVPDYFSLALVHARPEIIGGLPIIHLRAPVISGTDRIIKLVFDLIVSFLLLLVLWPVFLIITLLIRLDSPGPIIFHQLRVGENGEIFTMYKFRTMIQDAEKQQMDINLLDKDGNIIHKRPDDPRITRLGQFLRKTSLDELPQLFNVLKGEMSLVGPRPEMPWLVEKYESWQRKRFAVPQGITGWWQVNKREGGVMHLDTKDDLYYVYNYSLWLDIKILFMTFRALFRGY